MIGTRTESCHTTMGVQCEEEKSAGLRMSVRRKASLGLDFTMRCTSCGAAEVPSERQSQLMPRYRKKQGQAGVAGMSNSNGARSRLQLPCLVQPALSRGRLSHISGSLKARNKASCCHSNLRTHVLRHWKTSPQNLRPSSPP